MSSRPKLIENKSHSASHKVFLGFSLMRVNALGRCVCKAITRYESPPAGPLAFSVKFILTQIVC